METPKAQRACCVWGPIERKEEDFLGHVARGQDARYIFESTKICAAHPLRATHAPQFLF